MNDERRGAAVLGVVLIVVGGVFLLSNTFNIRLSLAWPLFIILPGVALFVAALVVGREPGSALAVAGSIVTTVGLVLAVQDATDLYATWAYAWALVAPTSVGVGLVLYGLITREPRYVSAGLPTIGIGLALFLGFALFFEGVIGLSGPRLAIVGELLPLGLVLLGVIIVAGSFRGRRRA